MTRTDGSDGVDRGISDVVAFSLSFGLIIASVAVVYSGGYTAIEGVYDSQRSASAQSGIEIVDSQIDDLVYHQVPRRSVSMNLRGGTFDVRQSTLEISVDNRTIRPMGVSMTVEGTTTHYASGAVITNWPAGSAMQREPGFRCASGTGQVKPLTLVNVRGDTESISGQTTIRMRVSHEETVLRRGNVSVVVGDGPTSSAWREYFENSMNGWTKASGTYWCNGTNVLVRESVVNISVRR